MASDAAVAVAVVSTNLRELLAKALESMRDVADAGVAEVWVVDNASTDGSAAMVREKTLSWVNLIASEQNLGYGRAINEVARRSARSLRPGGEGRKKKKKKGFFFFFFFFFFFACLLI